MDSLEVLEEAIDAQRTRLIGYERPSEVLAFETVRAIDHVYCRELFPERHDKGDVERMQRQIMSWGINHALARILPRELQGGPFRFFPSTTETRRAANDFLFSCGVLAMAERQASLLREGLLSASLEPVTHPKFRRYNRNILSLSATTPSVYSEAIGRRGLRWSSEQSMLGDSAHERDIEERHIAILPELFGQVQVFHESLMHFVTTERTAAHFYEWAEVYLRRMHHRDMIAPDEVIGGRPFSDYTRVLTALSARAQMQLCFAGIVKHRHPRLTYRNLLTGFLDLEALVLDIAIRLDANSAEIRAILDHLILQPQNLTVHVKQPDPAWAPAVRTSMSNCLLPAYGLDINPFLFLLNDLRAKYEKDWFRLANTRESRWIRELEKLFPCDRWRTNGRNVALKDGRQTVTDVDFAAYDRQTGELAVFQLKWQQPVGIDPKRRRSAGDNLLTECNHWIQRIEAWCGKYGAAEFARRLGMPGDPPPRIRLFILGRYAAHFSGFGGRNESAIWADWAHFQKVCCENPSASVLELADLLAAEIKEAQAGIEKESFAIPLPDLAVSVNPVKVPAAGKRRTVGRG